ncbi:response regulator [Acidisoma sp. 7E03]
MDGTLNVLVLEDDDVLRTSIIDALYELGYKKVQGFSTNEEALRYLPEDDHEMHLGLLDLNLGRETCYPTLAAFDRRRWPIILMSGLPAQEVPPTWGCRLCLKKPFGAAALEKALEERCKSLGQST